MAKVNNAVRIVEFEAESDLYAHMENDLVSCFDEPDSRCYKLKNIQLLDENHVILYFEEDINTIMVMGMNLMYSPLETIFETRRIQRGHGTMKEVTMRESTIQEIAKDLQGKTVKVESVDIYGVSISFFMARLEYALKTTNCHL